MAHALTPYEALLAVLDAAGSQLALAEICGVRQGTVSKWVNITKRLPAKYAMQVSKKTGVPYWLLAPDFYPHALPSPVDVPGEDCSPILAGRDRAVAFDRQAETKLTGTGQ
ncbi:transcriptional regulator [Croceibacterium ferulae]|uniref:transcriptional regulator n=1 Tax=Croceibacterium ferulae TaxID=1854641 RepID=UPI000EAF21E5|nr:YdaS family helix-turn-helix protein [Croceibacterium ferulae]